MRIQNFNKNKNFIIINNRLSSVGFFHTTTIIYSNRTDNVRLEELFNLDKERVSSLQLIKYNKIVEFEESNITTPISDYEDSFPWLLDENGNKIDFNEEVDWVEGVRLVHQFLQKRFDLDKDDISIVKISELIETFKDNGISTVLDLFNQVEIIYNNNKNSIISEVIHEEITASKISSEIAELKSMEEFGDKTLNELAEYLLNLKWDFIYNSVNITIHAAPLVINFITYLLILRAYTKFVLNRPYKYYLTPAQLNIQKIIRRKELAFYSVVVVPIGIIFLINCNIGFNDTFNLSLIVEGLNKNPDIISNSGIFLLLRKINNKIPTGIKFFFKILFLIIVILKILGYNIINDTVSDINFLKNFLYIYSSVVISYQILTLYLIHKFSTRKVKISVVLPDFIIDWLKEFEVMCSSKAGIEAFKDGCYIQIKLYLSIIIFIAIIS